MNSIYDLRVQREKIINNQNEILKLKKQISDLKIYRNVAIYAHSLDELMLSDEIHSHLNIMNNLRSDPHVQEYLSLKKELDLLEKQKKVYYRNIQTKLKENLNNNLKLNIYVYYGKDENDNIITKNIISPQLSDLNNLIVILPKNNIESKRKARHFYNKTSFKFLEELIKYNDFSVETKNLGKVKVLTKEKK